MPFTIYLWDLERGADKIYVLYKREDPDRDILYAIHNRRPKKIYVYGSLKNYIFVRHKRTYFCLGQMLTRTIPISKGNKTIYKQETWIRPSLPAPKEWIMALLWSKPNIRRIQEDVTNIRFWRNWLYEKAVMDREEILEEVLDILQEHQLIDARVVPKIVRLLKNSKQAVYSVLAGAGITVTKEQKEQIERGMTEEEIETAPSERGGVPREKKKKVNIMKYLAITTLIIGIITLTLGIYRMYQKRLFEQLLSIILGGLG